MGLPANGGGVAIEQKPFDERREKVFFKVFAHLRKYFKFNPPSIQGKQTALVNYVIKHFTSGSEGTLSAPQKVTVFCQIQTLSPQCAMTTFNEDQIQSLK